MTPEAAGTETPSNSYVILYFTERAPHGTLGPLKRARYATAIEAVGKAREMARGGALHPIEIRDPRDTLITCALMGWRLPELARTISPAFARADA